MMSRRRASTSSPAVRATVTGMVVVGAGVIAFLVTVNRTEIPSTAPLATGPPAAELALPSSTPSLDDLARSQLTRTVTIESLGANDVGLGTGWLLDTRGDFVTNAHVVQGQVTVRIRGRDGSAHVADVVGSDPLLDVAVVRSRDGFVGNPMVPFSGSITQFPQAVVAIASSHATGHGDITDESLTRVAPDVPVTGDTTSGEPATTTSYHDMLVLDGEPIYPGNSGGPVLDGRGRVVGIVTLASRSAPEGYAIQLSRVLPEIMAFAAK